MVKYLYQEIETSAPIICPLCTNKMDRSYPYSEGIFWLCKCCRAPDPFDYKNYVVYESLNNKWQFGGEETTEAELIRLAKMKAFW